MTTLPTRDDGGIDWDEYREILGCKGYSWPEACNIIDNMKLTEKHTRERCAKVAEDEHIERSSMKDIDRNTAYQIADEIRKLEV